MSALATFIGLQLADLLTTGLILHLGGFEMNPLVNGFMSLNPMAGLVVVKCLAVSIGAFSEAMGKYRVVSMGNYAYGAVVTWNLTQLSVYLGLAAAAIWGYQRIMIRRAQKAAEARRVNARLGEACE